MFTINTSLLLYLHLLSISVAQHADICRLLQMEAWDVSDVLGLTVGLEPKHLLVIRGFDVSDG